MYFYLLSFLSEATLLSFAFIFHFFCSVGTENVRGEGSRVVCMREK